MGHSNLLFLSVDDCIAVGQKLGDGDERVVLFVKPLQGDSLSPELVKRIQEAIKDRLSRRHVPAKILVCMDIPVSVLYATTCLLTFLTPLLASIR
jgi:acetoacetyl-CoA synthetase